MMMGLISAALDVFFFVFVFFSQRRLPVNESIKFTARVTNVEVAAAVFIRTSLGTSERQSKISSLVFLFFFKS